MIPTTGSRLFSVTGVTGVAVNGGASLGPIGFKFPRSVFVTGLLFFPRGMTRPEAAALQLAVIDETLDAMFTDGKIAQSLAALAMCGMGVRPFPLQRPVVAGDKWQFTVANVSGAPIVPELMIAFEEPQ